MTLSCNRCGETWERHPALVVGCPTCGVAAGVKCRRPSGHPCDTHVDREQDALDAGLMTRCPAAPPLADTKPSALQGALF